MSVPGRARAWIVLACAAATAALAAALTGALDADPGGQVARPAARPRAAQPRGPTVPQAGGDDGERPVGPCAHPYVPSHRGAWRRYSVTGPGAASGTVDLRLARLDAVTDTPSGGGATVEMTWHVTLQIDGAPSARLIEIRRCRPGHGAEDAWSGHMMRAPLIGTTGALWSWPLQLDEGVRFAAEVEVPATDDADGETLGSWRRNHEVEARERVRVPAGTFDCWRVAVTDRMRTSGTETRTQSTLWVAEGVGLVREIAGEGRSRQVRELVAWDGAATRD